MIGVGTMSVMLYESSDRSLVGIPVNAMISEPTNDDSRVYQKGTFYLTVNATMPWTIKTVAPVVVQ